MMPRKPYRVIVFWRDGRQTIEAESHNPAELAGAPTVARNPAAIQRIELHDLEGSLGAVWDAGWSDTP